MIPDISPDTLQATAGYRFQDPRHLQIALSHPSYTHSLHVATHAQSVESNQRYEFLGDAVLSLVISNLLLKKYPDAQEGDLSKLRARLVCEPTLAKMALHWGVDSLLLLSQGEESQGGRRKPSVLADAVEAIIGAIYLDGGIAAAEAVIARALEKLTEFGGSSLLTVDWKSRLQEFTQKGGNGALPEYSVLSATGPDHAKIFTVMCQVSGRSASGTGPSKKAAEQDAARQVMLALTDQSKDWEL